MIAARTAAPLAVSARAGVRSVTVEQVNAARSMGASQWQVVRHVILPAALPDILTGMRIAIGFGWTTLVAAEMVAANAGLGQMVLNASNFLRTDVVIMGIVVIGIVAIIGGIGANGQNVAFLVALAFAVAASANLPTIVYSLFWKKFTTQGALWSMYGGLASAIILISLSPDNVTGYITIPGATPGEVTFVWNALVRPETKEQPRFEEYRKLQMEWSNTIQGEDQYPCETMWANVHSPAFIPGPYADGESAVYDFDQWYLERMSD